MTARLDFPTKDRAFCPASDTLSRRSTRRLQPVLDALDGRLLPATGVTAVVAQGALAVQGTDNDDTIAVVVRSATARRGTVASQVLVYVDGVKRWRAQGVRSLVLMGSGGNDRITVTDASRFGVPLTVDAGSGDDTVIAGNGNATLLGGPGDDQLWGGRGHNLYDGGAGQDLVDGVWDPPAVPVAPPQPVKSSPTPPVTPAPTPTPVPSSPAAPPDLATMARQLVDLANLERRAAGLGELTVNARLEQAAQIHAADMARLDQMEHDLPTVAQPTLKSRADYVGYVFSWLGENIAYNYPDAGSVQFAWISSAGHRANILGPQFTEIGIGLARNSRGELYFCQVFGRPA